METTFPNPKRPPELGTGAVHRILGPAVTSQSRESGTSRLGLGPEQGLD